MSQAVKDIFAAEMAKEESEINLAYAAMLFSKCLTRVFDISLYLDLLDEMTESIRTFILPAETDLETVEMLNQYLFEELKFVGNTRNYNHPHNLLLNKVLDLRTGIPISLSLIYLEIGWRLGLPMWGGDLPKHFIVGYGLSDHPFYIDVFNQGRILDENDCLTLYQQPLSDHLAIIGQFSKPAAKKTILFRMLSILKQIYVGLEDWEAAYNTVDLMFIVKPGRSTELRDRGLLAYRLNHLHQAISDLERYIFLAPHNSDVRWVDRQLEMMEEKLLRLN